jgi:ATP-binding cassette subfamily F protein uup
LVLCSAVNISKSYSEKTLLKDISLYINEGDRIGVLGINGTGKSTFLKILAGLETPDRGAVTIANGVTIAYLPQNPVFEAHTTVLEQVFKGASQAYMDLKIYEAKTILTKLNLTDFDKPVSLLSGGEKKRVSIASALLKPCELLILDEPTNHIDNDMVLWLENYLAQCKCAIVMVTHDRYFLDRVTNKIAEIDNGSLYCYDANYSKFLELKAAREEMEAGTERKRRSLLKRELEWMQQGPKARSTKSKARIDRFEALSEQEGPAAAKKLELGSVASRLGKKTVQLGGISKSMNGVPLIKDFEYGILRDDRIGIIGKNGCGKSTLLKIICGDIAPDAGTIEKGETVKIGYYSQECEEMDTSLRVIDYIRSFAENIVTADGVLTASQMLERFLFPPDQQWNTIGRLSGGERRRLFLLQTIMHAPNILLLDEPTNDLDIMTLVILEDFLQSFKGAVVAVSHDRYFLDKIADKIFAFEDDGTIRQYTGGYSDYLQKRKDSAPKPEANKKQPASGGKPEDKTPGKPEDKASGKLKFTFKEQAEYKTIDAVIAGLEAQLAAVNQDIETQASDYVRLEVLLQEKAALEATLHEKMERWLYLNELASRISEQ